MICLPDQESNVVDRFAKTHSVSGGKAVDNESSTVQQQGGDTPSMQVPPVGTRWHGANEERSSLLYKEIAKSIEKGERDQNGRDGGGLAGVSSANTAARGSLACGG